jgi:peptide/nickel transport system permease protein
VAVFLIRRAATALVMMLAVAAMTFVVFYVVPAWGGRTTGQLAAQFAGRGSSDVQLRAVEHRLGLDRSLATQFWEYLKALVVGQDFPDGATTTHCPAPCFGYSWRLHEPVLGLLLSRVPITLSIAFGAAVIWLVVGVGSGALSATRRGTLVDRGIRIAALLGVCLPVPFIGPLARAELDWLFPSVTYSPLLGNPLTWADHLLLPWITLALGYFALYTRLTRAGMIDAFAAHFTRTAHAKGLPRHRIVWQALRVTFPAIATVFAMDLGLLLGGAVLAEKIYGLHGFGDLSANAVEGQDLPVLLGVTLFAGLFIVLANFVVDACYVFLDPRIRAE